MYPRYAARRASMILDRQEEITAIAFELDTAAIAHFHQMINAWTGSTRH